MNLFERFVNILTLRTAQVAKVALLFTMLITVLNVITRIRWSPIPGTVELIEMGGAILLSMSVAYTAIQKGHIMVGVLVEKFSVRTQAIVDILVNGLSLFFILFLTKEMFIYASSMMKRGYVTGHLNLPIAPSIYLVGFGFSMLTLVVLLHMMKAIITVYSLREENK